MTEPQRDGGVLDDGGDKKAYLRIFLRSVIFKVRCGHRTLRFAITKAQFVGADETLWAPF